MDTLVSCYAHSHTPSCIVCCLDIYRRTSKLASYYTHSTTSLCVCCYLRITSSCLQINRDHQKHYCYIRSTASSCRSIYKYLNILVKELYPTHTSNSLAVPAPVRTLLSTSIQRENHVRKRIRKLSRVWTYTVC